MLAGLLAIPILILVVIVQSAIVRATPLLLGSADLVMLTIIAWTLQDRAKAIWQWSLVGGLLVSLLSKAPILITLLSYLLVTGMVIYSRQRLWKAQYLVMWAMTLVGTVIIQGFTLLARWLEGSDIAFLQAFNLIILPSLLLNLLLAAPILTLARDMVNWLYPAEIST